MAFGTRLLIVRFGLGGYWGRASSCSRREEVIYLFPSGDSGNREDHTA